VIPGFIPGFGSWFLVFQSSWEGFGSCCSELLDFLLPGRFLVNLVSFIPHLGGIPTCDIKTDFVIEHRIKKYSSQHDLWLEFTRSGYIYLMGNILVNAIQELAIDGIEATQSTMSNNPIIQRQVCPFP
jgi:hypothetical protein